MECTANVMLASFTDMNSNRLAKLFSSALYGDQSVVESNTEYNSSGLQVMTVLP